MGILERNDIVSAIGAIKCWCKLRDANIAPLSITEDHPVIGHPFSAAVL
jgi:hypothetical protein